MKNRFSDQVANVAVRTSNSQALLVQARPFSRVMNVPLMGCAVWLCSGNIVNAAEDTSPTESTALPQVVVTASALETMTEGSGQWNASNSSSTLRLPMSVRKTPQSVSTLTRQHLDDRQLTSLEDAMHEVAGINVIKQSDNQYRFESRGFQMKNIQQDGVSGLAGAISGNAFYAASENNDLFIYDHVDVLRGATGLTEGSGSPGGTVNLVRKRPTDTFQAFTTMEIGSWGKRRNEFDLSGPVGSDGKLRGRLVGFDEQRGAPADEISNHSNGLYGVMEYNLTDKTQIGGGIYWQHSDGVPDIYGMPLYSNGQDTGLSRSTYLGADWNRSRFDKLNLFSDIKHYFDNDWVLTGSINYTQSNSISKYGANYGAYNGNTFSSNLGRYNNSSQQLSLNANATGPFELFGRKHELVLGSDISVEKNTVNRRNIVGGSTAKVTVNSIDELHSQPEPDWSSYSLIRLRPLLRQQAVYSAVRFSLTDSVKLIAGGRLSEYDSLSRTDWYDGDRIRSTSREHGVFTPYAGITWDFAENWTAYASYTDIFRPQSDITSSGKALGPVKGKSYETGIKSSLFDKRLSMSVALFSIDEANRSVIDTDATTGICANNGCSRPSGVIRSRGIETEVSGSPVDGITVGASYTYNDIFYKENEARYSKGERANAYTPRHILRLYSDYRFPGEWHKWRVGVGMSSQSGTQSIKPYSIRQGGYTLFDASVGYAVNDHVDVAFKAENLTDKRYYQTYNNSSVSGYNYFGTPRNVALKVTLRY